MSNNLPSTSGLEAAVVALLRDGYPVAEIMRRLNIPSIQVLEYAKSADEMLEAQVYMQLLELRDQPEPALDSPDGRFEEIKANYNRLLSIVRFRQDSYDPNVHPPEYHSGLYVRKTSKAGVTYEFDKSLSNELREWLNLAAKHLGQFAANVQREVHIKPYIMVDAQGQPVSWDPMKELNQGDVIDAEEVDDDVDE